LPDIDLDLSNKILISYYDEDDYNLYSRKYRLSFCKNVIMIMPRSLYHGYYKSILTIPKGGLNYASFKNHGELNRFVDDLIIFL
jgi:hypothetical protein